MVFSCFRGCLRLTDQETKYESKASSAACRRAGRLSRAVKDDWQSVPDDVLQAMVAYLSPADVAVARRVCRHWRCMLSCYTTALTLPTSFMSHKSAKAALRSSSSYFPSLTKVNLHHTAGWCDPVQARMDVEPLVRQERRSVSLEPLAAAFSQLQQLSISDATYTRDPWSLEQLAWLPKLSSLSMSWDTGLWAPGQVAQEADALQPVFTMTQLTALQLSKHAHLFLGEIPLGDMALTAAAHLNCLARLDLATVSASDEGFAALAGLTGLTQLSLTGQIAVSLGVLAKVFSGTTNLQVLSLQGLLPCSSDLKRIAVAYSGGQHAHSSRSRRHGSRHRRPSSSSASPSSSLGSSYGSSSFSSSNRSSHGRSLTQQEQQLQQPFRGSGGGWRTSRLWQQQELRSASSCSTAQPAISSSSSRVQAAPLGHQGLPPLPNSVASSPGSSSAPSPHSSSKSSSRGRLRSADWTVVLLPLRRLRMLKLQSDMAFLGSCAALRSMGHVTHIRLHGAAKFLQHGPHLQPYAALPPSWLSQLAREASAAVAAAAAAEHCGSSSSVGAARLRAGGVWPGLVSLQVDNLQLADGFIQGVAQLENLKTLVVSGPCLLAAQQQLQQQQQHNLGPFPGGQHHDHQLSHQQQQQQAASAPGWNSACSSAASRLSDLPDLSSLSAQGFSKPKALDAWAAHKISPADPAAVLEAALAALKLGPDSSSSTSTISSSSTSTVATTTTSTSSGGSQRSPAPLLNASGMQQQEPPMLAALAAMQQQQQMLPVFRPVLDADVLTRLSPLSQLSKFELHLQQQQLPCGMCMTPFALAHLSASWTGLTSLSLNVPAPPSQPVATAGGACGMAASRVLQSVAGQLFASLGSMQSLKHLELTLSDGGPGLAESAVPPPFSLSSTLSGGLLGTALPPTPEQPAGAPGDSEEIYSSGSNAVAAAVAVAALPWQLLPASLESLSLSGFIGVQAESIKAVAAAAPQLRHLRLLYCQVTTSVAFALCRWLPLLFTLVVKEDALGGVGSSGVAAIAGLSHIVSLGVTVEAGADVSTLGHTSSLRYLLLDGRSNMEMRGIKGLGHLHKLKTLILPLLHLHHTNNTLLTTMQLALPHTHIMNVSRNFGQHHGCQWFKCFSASDREWWAQPVQPWAWHPTLEVVP